MPDEMGGGDGMIKPYTGRDCSCVKCLVPAVSTEYHRPGNGYYCRDCPDEVDGPTGEHFLRTCRNCGFEWVEGMPE